MAACSRQQRGLCVGSCTCVAAPRDMQHGPRGLWQRSQARVGSPVPDERQHVQESFAGSVPGQSPADAACTAQQAQRVHLGCWAMSGQAAPLRPGCTGLGAWACSFDGYSQAAGPKYGLTEVWAERSKASRLV